MIWIDLRGPSLLIQFGAALEGVWGPTLPQSGEFMNQWIILNCSWGSCVDTVVEPLRSSFMDLKHLLPQLLEVLSKGSQQQS